MKRTRIIPLLFASLLIAQSLPGQQHERTAEDTNQSAQTRIRIPRTAIQSELNNRAGQSFALNGEEPNQTLHSQLKNHAGKLPEIYREDIRRDSIDLTIDPSALQQFQSQFPGLRVLKAAPLIDITDMADDLAEAMTFQKYPTYNQYVSMMQHYASTYPSICRLDTFGTSVEGRLLLALKISDNVDQQEDEPAFFYTSTMHGDELVGLVLCLRLADFLLSNYGSNTEVDRIINDVELWINPLSNPDGTYYPDNNNTVQASIRNNVNGVNLNRDFPDPSLGEADDPSGRQPETRHMMAFMQEIRPNLSANIHAGAEVVNYPWDHKEARHPDDDWYILVSQEYADEARAVEPSYLNLYASGITNGADWYIIKGGRQDYVNYYLHGREVTLELSAIKQLESEYLEDHWNYNKWSLVNLVTQARYGIHGNVTDTAGNPVGAVIWVSDHDNDSSWVESDPSSGNFYRYLKEGIYDLVVTAEGYLPDTLSDVQVNDYQKTMVSVQLESTLNGTSDRTDEPGDRTENESGNDAEKLMVYPNPASGLLHIRTTEAFSGETVFRISDLTGRLLLQVMPPTGTNVYVMDLSELETGTYVLHRSGDNHPASKIILKRK